MEKLITFKEIDVDDISIEELPIYNISLRELTMYRWIYI